MLCCACVCVAARQWYDQHKVAPAFAFGHGLSYTSFHYGSIAQSASGASPVTFQFNLTNNGTRAGSETAQLYLGFPAAAGEPPRVLRQFAKVHLQPGQSELVRFALSEEQTSVWDVSSHGWRPVHGQFEAFVGASSRDVRQTASFARDPPQ